jgi:hypothetical protein
MHNSGIVGVVAEHRDALLRSVEIADALHSVDPVFSLDQFSTGAALGHKARIETCEKEILHYYGWKRAFMRDAIDDFWRQNINASLAELCAAFKPADFALIPRINWKDKLHAHYLQFRWKLESDGRFACIALKSTLRQANSDTDAANNWFTVHLKFLDKQQTTDNDAAKRLLTALKGSHQQCRPWLNTANAVALDYLIDACTDSGSMR